MFSASYIDTSIPISLKTSITTFLISSIVQFSSTFCSLYPNKGNFSFIIGCNLGFFMIGIIAVFLHFH